MEKKATVVVDTCMYAYFLKILRDWQQGALSYLDCLLLSVLDPHYVTGLVILNLAKNGRKAGHIHSQRRRRVILASVRRVLH